MPHLRLPFCHRQLVVPAWLISPMPSSNSSAAISAPGAIDLILIKQMIECGEEQVAVLSITCPIH